MRKLCLLFCSILILQLLVGCSKKNEDIQQPVNFYYTNKEITYNTSEGVFRAEIREGSQFQDLEDLLHVYMQGPISSSLESLLPGGVSLLSCAVENEIAYIRVNTQFSDLSGVKLTTVCSAMLLTAHDYNGVQAICVRAENSKLDDKEEFYLSLDDIVLLDTVASEEPKE